MDSLVEEIEALVKPICERLGYYLVEVEVRGGFNNRVVAVYADTEQGITLDEITRLTREIEDVLEIRDPIEGSYRLEVSSPGLTRPLREIWQFRRNIGRQLRVVFDSEDGRKDFIGILSEVREDGIALQLKKKLVSIPFETIVKAQVKPKW